MQFQNPVILYLKICPLQEYSETAVIYHLLNCVVTLGTFLGSCKSSAIWYCYSVLWGFLIKKKKNKSVVLTIPTVYLSPH